jgi:hypothetical protein
MTSAAVDDASATASATGSSNARHNDPVDDHIAAVGSAIANPTTTSFLLAEEYGMNPATPLPSFLEMNLVGAAAVSGRRTVGAVLDGLRGWCDGVAAREGRRRDGDGNGDLSTGRGVNSSAAGRCRMWLVTVLSRLLARYRSEWVFLLTLAVERYSLRASSATAAEAVYGLTRSRVVRSTGNGDSGGGIQLAPLTGGDKVRCALVAALLPYLRDKMASLHRAQQQQRQQQHQQLIAGTNGRMERLRLQWGRMLGTVYPYLRTTAEGTALLYQFLYLAGMTGYYSPSMHALGVLARRTTQADLQARTRTPANSSIGSSTGRGTSSSAGVNGEGRELQGTALAKPSARNSGEGGGSPKSSAKPPQTAIMSRLQSGQADRLVRTIRTAIVVGGSALLVTGWIAHFREELRQRRRRWIAGDDDDAYADSANGETMQHQQQQQQQQQQQRRHRGRSTANGSIWTPQSNPIPPPHPPKLLDESESDCVRRGLPTDRTSCPICHRPRVHPAASTSGYVFCYRCLVMHLRNHGERCPVTGMHCPESRVIRLFEPTAVGSGGGTNDRDREEGRKRDESQGAGQVTG